MAKKKKKTVSRAKRSQIDDLLTKHPNLSWLLPVLALSIVLIFFIQNT